MIIPDRKKATTVILSRLMKDGGAKDMPVKPEAELEPKPDDEPLTIAAQDIMQAFHDKSVLGLRESLKSFFHLIDDDSEGQEQAEE